MSKPIHKLYTQLYKTLSKQTIHNYTTLYKTKTLQNLTQHSRTKNFLQHFKNQNISLQHVTTLLHNFYNIVQHLCPHLYDKILTQPQKTVQTLTKLYTIEHNCTQLYNLCKSVYNCTALHKN